MTVGDALVSVVIPVYNGDRYLGRTLASALAQNYHPIEVIVVDDGSTDHTAELVESAAARDSRIQLFRTPNSGVAAARNFGISQASGNLIALLDADDLWHPEKIARQVKVMQAAAPEVGLVYCWSIEIDENDFVILPAGSKAAVQGRITAELARGNFIQNSSSPLIRRSYFDAVGGYDCNLRPQGAEDWKFYLALSEICEFAVIPEYLVGYRQSAGSLSRNVAGMAQSTELVVRWMIEKWPELSVELRRLRKYNTNAYLAWTALRNKQLLKALQYWAGACRARPVTLFEQSSLYFVVDLLARLSGLRPIARRIVRKWRGTPIPFQQFAAVNKVRTSFHHG
jgi:glycosyltransferase involved in cell wall biosynthesis